MGYCVYIERNSESSDKGSGGGICLEEWLTYIENDATTRLEKAVETTSPNGDVIRYESDGLAIWLDDSAPNEMRNKAWFDFRNNRISVENPSVETLQKMYQIASYFDAKVVGEAGEEYSADGKLLNKDKR